MAQRRSARDRGKFPVLFSIEFGIEDADQYPWFDMSLTRDSSIFVDPFLVNYSEVAELHEGADDLYGHFRLLFTELARDRSARLTSLLRFPEVDEIGLGYAKSGHRGAGSGGHYAREIRDAMVHAIRAGVESPRHFEEIGLLRKGLGKDRISDIAARILLPRFARFTSRVCGELGVPTHRQRLWTYFRTGNGLPYPAPFPADVPRNPYSRRPIVLVPKDVLRRLPTISPNGFEDYLWEVHQDELRRQFNIEVKRDLGPYVLQLANANLEWVREYVAYEEERGPRPYDFKSDPSGVVRPTRDGYAAGRRLPPAPQASSEGEVLAFVRFLARHYKAHIETQRGYELLWDSSFSRHRTEPIAQRLFQAMARAACDQNNITMAKETNAGTGPVDFMFSTGYSATVLLELKHIANSRYWDGPAAQLPDYLRAQDARTALFMAIAYRDSEVRSVRFRELAERVAAAAAETGFDLSSTTVDARPRPTPASRLRRR